MVPGQQQVAGAAVTANPTLAADPAYLAYLRSLGISDALDEAQGVDQQNRIRQGLSNSLYDIGQAGTLQREGISGTAESRGIYRSGEHELALARQRADQARNESKAREGATRSVADLLTQIARNKAARARGGAEQAIGTATALYGSGY